MRARRDVVIRQGLVAGLLGYGGVVAIFALLNLSQGLDAFHTPRILGSALLAGALDPVEPLAAIFAYNGLHLLASLAMGLIGAILADRAEEDHALAMGLVFAVLAMGGWIPLVFGAVTVEMLGALRWVEVLLGTGTGALFLVGTLAWAHRALLADLFREAEA
jgi:hypothetical protein